MKKETLERLIKGYKGNNLAGYLSGEIKKVESIKNKLAQYREELSEIERKYNEEVKAKRTKIYQLQEECPHHETTYYPDASGNNDSSYFCDICGLERRRF